ncbi:hypothetical protein A8W25_22265 [Streptomyces sp. ERV7]|uniref:Lar family restriction alleviation protein n=1 Tax=Streptomyces sp. ERV7 TaxID=1322334 RepID=UPI0007F37DA5|nr:Lar family restriction alleviation protein [Streptomyces sp. ERV7]OAR22381.1 hypothetical protein A8W25_22265 [Streptomyces sp. ERV7]
MTTALDYPLTPSPLAYRADDDLAAVREQWGDLLTAIGQRPLPTWPPRERRGYLDQLAADDRTEDDEQTVEPVVGRLPLTIREHPAPLNLDALDAAVEVERALFGLADRVAEQVQRSVRTVRDGRGRHLTDPDDAADPARWQYQAPTSPGSRAYGLHWAAVWIAGRVLDEDDVGGLFTSMPARLLDEVAATARTARRTVERALGRDGRTTDLAEPCPWCGGQLAGHTRPGGEPGVTCSTGPDCTAPVETDRRGRRTWKAAELVDLWVALDAARRRTAEA